MRTLLKTMIALIAGLALVLVWPQARLAALWAMGRSQCSWRDTLDSHALLTAAAKAADEIGAGAKVVQSDPNGLELVETSMGAYWTVRGDRFLRFTLAGQKEGIYDGVKTGDVVLDCGANIGAFTRTALNAGARLVIAIEPAPRTVECLRRTFSREIEAGRVVVVPKGVWDRPDVLELAEGGAGNNAGDSFVFGRNQSGMVKVPLTTIDILANELGLPRVDFIKMDIEGAEKEALRGGANTIRKYRPALAIAAEHFPDDATAIPRLVRSIWDGYSVQPSCCKDAFLSVKPEVLRFQPQGGSAGGRPLTTPPDSR